MSKTFYIEKETGKVAALSAIPPYFSFLKKAVPQIAPEDYSDVTYLGEERLSDVKANALGVPMQCPLQMRLDGGAAWWLLPFEPIITIHGKNVIAKKQVAKGKVRGTIKERWAQDDYQITISGILMNTDSSSYPEEDVKQLKSLCEAAKVEVMSPIFEIFSIDKIVIENYDFPFTAGPNNQGYIISAVSDDIYKLLLREEDLKLQ